MTKPLDVFITTSSKLAIKWRLSLALRELLRTRLFKIRSTWLHRKEVAGYRDQISEVVPVNYIKQV